MAGGISSFPAGLFSCVFNACGLGPFNLSSSGGTVTANPFGVNGATPFTVDGTGINATSNSNNLTILGAPQHRCTLQFVAPNTIFVVCQPNFGAGPGSCASICN